MRPWPMRLLVRRLVASIVLGAIIGAIAATGNAADDGQASTPDPFASVTALLGRWTGTAEGQPGRGTSEREYVRAVGDRFIRVRNTSRYPPQAANTNGETHEDEGFISVDRARKRLVFRQFHSEGFVNHYVEAPESTATHLVFASEAIENIPAGWRARETYLITAPDAFEEIFELAEPGQPFKIYSRTRFVRVR